MIKMIKMIIVIGTELANVAHSVQNLGLAGNRKRSPGTLIIIIIIFPAKKIDFDLDGGFNLFLLDPGVPGPIYGSSCLSLTN